MAHCGRLRQVQGESAAKPTVAEQEQRQGAAIMRGAVLTALQRDWALVLAAAAVALRWVSQAQH